MFKEMFKRQNKEVAKQFLLDSLMRFVGKNFKGNLGKYKNFVEDQILRPFVESLSNLGYYDFQEAARILSGIFSDLKRNLPKNISNEFIRLIKDCFFVTSKTPTPKEQQPGQQQPEQQSEEEPGTKEPTTPEETTTPEGESTEEESKSKKPTPEQPTTQEQQTTQEEKTTQGKQQPEQQSEEEPKPEEQQARLLNPELDKTLREFFREEGKGENFREKADPEFLRGYLYLILPEGDLKNKFKSDFERLMSAKEKTFWLSFLPPFLKKGFKPGEFPEELQSRIEDLSKGKSRITLEFTQEDLPDDIKNEVNKIQNEDERNKFLESLSIHQVGNKYEIYITQDKLAEIIGRYTETLGNSLISEARVQKQINDIQKKLKEVKPLFGEYYGAFSSLFAGLLTGINELKKGGGSEEERKKIEEQLNKFSQVLDPIVQEKDKTKAQGKALNFFKGAGGFLKEAGFWAGMTAGIFGLMLFWFLPLWLIVKMNKEIGKFVGGK